MRGILYLNQFFGQVGGEEAADFAPELRCGAVGPGMALNAALGEAGEITHTVVCGDNFMGSHPDEAVEAILKLLETLEFDVLFAGPAFRAGRYGVACGRICKKHIEFQRFQQLQTGFHRLVRMGAHEIVAADHRVGDLSGPAQRCIQRHAGANCAAAKLRGKVCSRFSADLCKKLIEIQNSPHMLCPP